MVKEIVKDIDIVPRTSSKPVPASTTKLFNHIPSSPYYQGHFEYSSAIGKPNYATQCKMPEIMNAVHNGARFCFFIKKDHGEAVDYLGKYLRAFGDNHGT